MKNLLYSVFIVSVLVITTQGCFDNEICCPPPPSIDVSLSYVHEDGTDLLKHDTASLEEFDIYYLIKNNKTGEFERQQAASNQFSFYLDDSTGRAALRVFPNHEFVNDTSLTFIDFPSNNVDTLKVKGRREGRGARAEKIWYNGEKVWETKPNPPRRFFTFIKSVL